jgi:hypothetical protein
MKFGNKRTVSGAETLEEVSRLSREGEGLVMAFDSWLLNCEEHCKTTGTGQEPEEMDLGLSDDKEEKLSELAESHGLTRTEFIAQIVNENIGKYGKPLLSQKRRP